MYRYYVFSLLVHLQRWTSLKKTVKIKTTADAGKYVSKTDRITDISGQSKCRLTRSNNNVLQLFSSNCLVKREFAIFKIFVRATLKKV
jgi:hypothetical protein